MKTKYWAKLKLIFRRFSHFPDEHMTKPLGLYRTSISCAVFEQICSGDFVSVSVSYFRSISVNSIYKRSRYKDKIKLARVWPRYVFTWRWVHNVRFSFLPKSVILIVPINIVARFAFPCYLPVAFPSSSPSSSSFSFLYNEVSYLITYLVSKLHFIINETV